MDQESVYAAERKRMVDNQLRRRDIRDERVLDVMGKVPRHMFVGSDYTDMAYSDGPLPIGIGQTISQPYIVALMTQLLELSGDEIVLEVGTGSGYQAAVLSFLAKEIHTIERHKQLAREAERVLQSLGLSNVYVHVGDGTTGLEDKAPFDGILVTAAAPNAPQTLLDQLVDGGRLVIPVGGRGGQMLELWTRSGVEFNCENILPVAFVPLLGLYGWDE